MQNKLFLLGLPILFLAGCATTAQEPTIRTVIQRVEIPIPVLCKVEIPGEPDFYFDKVAEGDDLYEKVKAIMADRELRIGYEGELLTALKSCVDEVPPGATVGSKKTDSTNKDTGKSNTTGDTDTSKKPVPSP